MEEKHPSYPNHPRVRLCPVQLPPEEQIKELWEWCDVHVHEWREPTEGEMMKAFPGRICSKCNEEEYDYDLDTKTYTPKRLPPIDLNNLFKYAVPKLDLSGGITFNILDNGYWEVVIEYKGMSLGLGDAAKNPALALFWAIWEVIECGK